jgi:hypothetical protein
MIDIHDEESMHVDPGVRNPIARPGTLNSNYDLQAVFLHKRTSLPRDLIRPQLQKWVDTKEYGRVTNHKLSETLIISES